MKDGSGGARGGVSKAPLESGTLCEPMEVTLNREEECQNAGIERNPILERQGRVI